MSVRGGPEKPGLEIPGYQIEALLGRGGMAAVFRARDLRLNRRVALKLLASHLAEDESFRERFLRESRLAASLDHPNVIPIYEAGEAEGVLFIAMRYVEGTDLSDVIEREGALAPDRALSLLVRVGDALDAAHARGLVHRDVKPANILIARDPERDPPEHVYLSDFGLTKSAASQSGLTQTGQLIGTPDYVAPEQIAKAPLDARTDVYSLGCVWFECLTGEPPFHDDSLMAVLWSHVNDPPPKVTDRRPDLPSRIDAVLAKAMAKRTGERYANCRELATDIRDALGIPQQPRVVAPTRRRLLPHFEVGRRRLRRARNRLFLGIGALMIAGVTALALMQFADFGGDTESAGSRAAATVVPNSVAVIDPSTNEIVADVAVGKGVGPIAIGGGSVWVGNITENTISRIDPNTRTVVQTIGLGMTPDWLAFANGALWILDMGCKEPCGAGDRKGPVTLASFDVKTQEVGELVELGPGGRLRINITANEDAVWVSNVNNGMVYRIDPATSRVTTKFSLGVPSAIAVDDNSVWVVDDLAGTIERINLDSRSVTSVKVGADPEGIAVAGGDIWVSNFGPEPAVWRIDAQLGEVEVAIPVPSSPTAVVASGDSVWFTHYAGGLVSRIDAGTNNLVETIELGHDAYVLAVGEGLVWVTVRGDVE